MPRQVVGREREAVDAGQLVFDGLRGSPRRALRSARRSRTPRRSPTAWTRHRDRSGRGLREEARDELGAVGRQLEERLVHQVELQVPAADVHDERDRRLEGGDVGEVLFGPDADVRAAARDGLEQIGDDELQPRLVRQEVVGPECSPELGEVGGQRPEFLIGEARRQAARGRRLGRPRSRHDEGGRDEGGQKTGRRPFQHAR